MYYISKSFDISAAHAVQTREKGGCEELHGHNWKVTVHCKAAGLDENGMVVDFRLIKERIKKALDHKNLNEVLPFNPTAENLACWICGQIPRCYKVEVAETGSNRAVYEADD